MGRTIVLAFFIVVLSLSSAFSQTSRDYRSMSLDALAVLDSIESVPFERTEHPGGQWFPRAGFGLFIHWGIHSTAGIEPSWAMMKNCPWQQDYYDYLGWDRYLGRENYYRLLYEFNPSDYDPDKWIQAAADAGMTYAVITTKHHDGFALWPSEYGELSTKQYLEGRDLIRPFVEACRRNGLKVGFYFSPRDWGYPGFPQSMDYKKPYEFPDDWTPEKNREAFENFYGYTVGQLSELLTRYGPIDLLWFDGMGWKGIEDIHTDKTLAWIRRLQPHIVINPRWGGVGDFETPEVTLPEDAPEGWWENCISWCGHWGYSPHAPFQSTMWVMTRLVNIRSWGGNLLLNVGPAGDGTMRSEYYRGLSAIGAWMKKCGDTLIGADPVRDWADFCNVPVTSRKGVWYLHVLPLHNGAITLHNVPEPKSVVFYNYDTIMTNYTWDAATGTLTVPYISMTMRDDLDNVLAVYWDEEPVR